jgi:ribosomal protein L29
MAHLDGSFQLEENRLRDENLTGLGAEVTNLRLEQLNLLARAATPHLQKPVDD